MERDFFRPVSGSGQSVPRLWIDLEVCREMGWSWPELEQTPQWVRDRAWDYVSIRRHAEAEAMKPKQVGDGKERQMFTVPPMPPRPEEM